MARTLPPKSEENSALGFFLLLMYTIAVFIRPQEWNYSAEDFPIARLILILAFLCYLLLQKSKVWGYQAWFLVGLVVVPQISGIRNAAFLDGFTQAQNMFIYALLPYLLYSGYLNTQKKSNYILFILAVASIVMLHHGIGQKFSPDGIGWTGEKLSQGTRITYIGIFNDPNDLAMFFVMCVPLMFYLKENATNLLLKLGYFSLIIGLFYGIFLTNSRGGLVGVLSMTLCYFYFQYGKFKTILLTIVTVPIVYVVMSKFRAIDSQEDSAQGRIQAWYDGIQMFKYRPLTGVGKGEFFEIHYRTAHNSYVLILAELGIIGYTFWFMAIALTLMMLVRVFRLDADKYCENKELLSEIFLAKCLFFSFIGYMSTAFFLSRSYMIFLFIFIGISCALFYRVLKQVPEIVDVNTNKNIFRLIFASFASVVLLYIIIIALL